LYRKLTLQTLPAEPDAPRREVAERSGFLRIRGQVYLIAQKINLTPFSDTFLKV